MNRRDSSRRLDFHVLFRGHPPSHTHVRKTNSNLNSYRIYQRCLRKRCSFPSDFFFFFSQGRVGSFLDSLTRSFARNTEFSSAGNILRNFLSGVSPRLPPIKKLDATNYHPPRRERAHKHPLAKQGSLHIVKTGGGGGEINE